MPFPSSGAVSLSSLKSYFTAYTTTGYTGNNLSDYYRGRLVPNNSKNSGVPTSGSIAFGDLLGVHRGRSVTVSFTATTMNSGSVGWHGSQNLFDSMRVTLLQDGSLGGAVFNLVIGTSSGSMPASVANFYEFRLMNSSGSTLWTNTMSSYSSQPTFRVYDLGTHEYFTLGISYKFSVSWIE